MNILITGCNAPGTPGTLLALERINSKLGLSIYGTEASHIQVMNNRFAEIFKVPHATANNYFAVIEELITRFEIDVVIPQTTDEAVAFSKYYDSDPGKPKILIPGFGGIIQRANDKFQLLTSSRNLGLPTAEFHSLAAVEQSVLREWIRQDDHFYLKMRNESGGRGIIKVYSDSGFLENFTSKPGSVHSMPMSYLDKFIENCICDDFFVMKKVTGVEYTIDAFRDREDFIAIPRKRVSIRNGVSQINLIERNRYLIEATEKLASHFGFRGIFGFQFIFNTESDFSIIECNPRVQGTSIASLLAGSNILEHSILKSLNRESSLVEPRWGSTFIRTSSGVIY
jgi:carbamoyl-phosphate synthase large subunit